MKLINTIREPRTEDYLYNRRMKHTLDFIEKNGCRAPILCTGKAEEFEKRMGFKIDYTDFDLNWEFELTPRSKYKTIFCFHVIEHLMNPLLFLNQLSRMMDKESLLYIVYPTHGIKLFWCNSHFHEYDVSRFHYLLNEAELDIVDYKTVKMWRKLKRIGAPVRNTPIGMDTGHYYCLKKRVI